MSTATDSPYRLIELLPRYSDTTQEGAVASLSGSLFNHFIAIPARECFSGSRLIINNASFSGWYRCRSETFRALPPHSSAEYSMT